MRVIAKNPTPSVDMTREDEDRRQWLTATKKFRRQMHQDSESSVAMRTYACWCGSRSRMSISYFTPVTFLWLFDLQSTSRSANVVPCRNQTVLIQTRTLMNDKRVITPTIFDQCDHDRGGTDLAVIQHNRGARQQPQITNKDKRYQLSHLGDNNLNNEINYQKQAVCDSAPKIYFNILRCGICFCQGENLLPSAYRLPK